jgi:DNA (cytosine-5)-methyltransferase 1
MATSFGKKGCVMMTPLRVGSVFSGIGGLDLGIEQAGIGRTVYQVELQDFQRSVLRQRWRHAFQGDDITRAFRHGGFELPDADVIVGGFPCTGFSRAGQGAGLRNPASALWFDMLRIIVKQQPVAIVIENVMSLLQERFAEDRATIYKALIGLGYDVAPPYSVSSAEVGAPHRRERVFILAVDRRRAAAAARHLGPVGDPIAKVWPAGRNEARRRGEPPRTIQKKLRVPGKRDRLYSLGNAVVPDVGRVVGIELRQMLGGAPGRGRTVSEAAHAPSPRYWPTPVYRDASGARRDTARKDHWTSKPGETLTDAVWLADKKDWDRPLNPDWVEALMGFPPGWTQVSP